ncbi:MAG: NAD(P)-binding domain-containing protein, partial [Prevotella sp.]|nr:NAD(P)-binding domain-containing protein [Prevotella sp.]
MKISVIGAGAMGGAMVQGMLKGKTFANDDITVADPSAKALEQFDGTGATITTDNTQAATASDIVAVVVKPWLVE